MEMPPLYIQKTPSAYVRRLSPDQFRSLTTDQLGEQKLVGSGGLRVSVGIDTVSEQLGDIIGFDFLKLDNAQKDYIKLLSNFLNTIQNLGLPKPEFSGSLDENISLEWRSASTDEFVITIKPNSSMIFSGVFKTGNIFGAESFDGNNISENIKSNILKSA